MCTRQMFHAAQNKAVSLGTAMVNIVHQGVLYPARALKDPISNSSLFQSDSKIVSPFKAFVPGVSCSLSATANIACRVKISSPFDTALLFETSVLVLRSISGNLPSFVVNTNMETQITGLWLPDVFCFFFFF